MRPIETRLDVKPLGLGDCSRRQNKTQQPHEQLLRVTDGLGSSDP
jgi:hypothetical protein